MYRERPSPVAGGVLWTRQSSADETEFRVLPDGCMDLIWSDGRLLVAGPDTRPQLTATQPGTTYVGVRFPPGVGPIVVGTPADVVRDQRIALDALWPAADVRRLTEQVATSSDPARALEAVAAARLQRAEPPDPWVPTIVATLAGGRSVADTAVAVGFSERQLHRRCLAAFGYGPKTLARILRLERTLGLARGGTPLATVAAAAGYADQAHMAREVKALTGLTPVAVAQPQLT